MEKIEMKSTTNTDSKGYFNRVAEFSDPKMEKLFRNDYLISHRSFSSLILIFTSTLFLLLGLFDINDLSVNFPVSMIVRAVVLAFLIGAAVILKQTKRPKLIAPISFIAKGILIIGTFALLFIEGGHGFFELLPYIIVLEFALALISLRWFHAEIFIICTIILVSAFAPLYYETIADNLLNFLQGILVLIVAGISGIYVSRALHIQNRLQFIKELELEESSITDSLTKINNRFKFDSVLENSIKKSSLTDHQFSLIMYDIDNFKSFNDKYGHIVGDKILISISNIVLENIRKTDVFARWGGEEFILLLPDTALKDATAIAEKLRILIATNEVSVDLRLTVSLGVTAYDSGDTADTIIRKVDSALYRAKKEGKNRVVIA